MLISVFALTLAQPAVFQEMSTQPPVVQEEATPTLEDAPGLFRSMVNAFKEKNFPLAFGSLALLLSLVVGVISTIIKRATTISDETRKKILPWLVAAGGCLVAFGLALIGGLGWANAITAGLFLSAAATGLWELILKNILKAATKK